LESDGTFMAEWFPSHVIDEETKAQRAGVTSLGRSHSSLESSWGSKWGFLIVQVNRFALSQAASDKSDHWL
jgi:hypothetical protein